MKALNRQLFKVIKAQSEKGIFTVLRDGADPSWINSEITVTVNDNTFSLNALEYAVLNELPFSGVKMLYDKKNVDLEKSIVMSCQKKTGREVFEWLVNSKTDISEALAVQVITTLIQNFDAIKLSVVMKNSHWVNSISNDQWSALQEAITATKNDPLARAFFHSGRKIETEQSSEIESVSM